MADLSTNIPQISFGQADKETAVNELFDAASPSMLFGRNGIISAGLEFGIFGGRWNGAVVANKVLALTNNSTLYISANLSTGSATFQTGSFKTGEMPLYKVTTSGGLVTDYEDHRAAYGIGIPEAPTDGKQYARKNAGWAEVAASMEAATYDPQGIEGDAFDRANHTGTQPMESISDKQGKVFTDPIILSDITDLDGVVDEGLYFCDLSCGAYSGSEVRVYEIVDSVIGLARLQAVSGPGGATQSRVYLAGAWQPFGTSVTDQQVANWYNDTTTDAPNAVIKSDGSFSRSIATFNPNPLLVVSGVSHAFVKADVNKYARYTDTGAKAATFDSSEGFDVGDAFHITNRAASGNITISGTGVTFNAPKGGTLVLEPADTVTVKFISSTEADVMGSTGVA